MVPLLPPLPDVQSFPTYRNRSESFPSTQQTFFPHPRRRRRSPTSIRRLQVSLHHRRPCYEMARSHPYENCYCCRLCQCSTVILDLQIRRALTYHFRQRSLIHVHTLVFLDVPRRFNSSFHHRLQPRSQRYGRTYAPHSQSCPHDPMHGRFLALSASVGPPRPQNNAQRRIQRLHR